MSKLETSDLLTPYAKCPNCRLGDLFHESLYTWKCSTCGFSTVKPPAKSLQKEGSSAAGRETPLTRTQKDALRRGREQWRTLIRVGRKAAVSYILAFFILAFTLDLALSAALSQGLTLSWTIAAWVGSAFLGLVGAILFYISSTKRRAIYATILVFFIFTGRFWYELTLHTLALL